MGCGPSRFGPVLHLKGALVASMSAEIGAIVPGTSFGSHPTEPSSSSSRARRVRPHLRDRPQLCPLGRGAAVDDDAVTVKVVGVKEDGKIDLSIKQAASDWQPEAGPRRPPRTSSSSRSSSGSCSSSEERLVDVKRQREGRRG